jgi:hypothetical protein
MGLFKSVILQPRRTGRISTLKKGCKMIDFSGKKFSRILNAKSGLKRTLEQSRKWKDKDGRGLSETWNSLKMGKNKKIFT